jgi:hypothetical protein
LVADLVAGGTEAAVSPTMRETAEVVAELAADFPCSGIEVAEKLNIDKSSASRRLKQAEGDGYVQNLEVRPGHPGQWVTGHPLPDGVEVLPNPERLAALLNERSPECCMA